MSAVADAPEAIVAQPLNGTLFAARREDLRLVKVPRYPIYAAGGRQVGEERGETLAFRAGKLFVPNDGDVILEDGGKLDGAEALEWLRAHRLYDDANGGFFEVKTDTPPVSQAEITTIVDAALAFDIDTLRAVLEAERAGWGREEVTSQVEATIAKILAAQERQREMIEAEAKAAAEAAAKPAPKAAAKS